MYQNKFLIYLLLLCFASNLQAQNEIPQQNYLKWGNLIIPINELVNGSNGELKVKLETILGIADQPLILIKKDRDAQLSHFFLIISKRGTASPTEFLAVRDYDKKDAASHHGRAYLQKHLQEGENIYFRNLIGKDSIEYFLRIEILEENPIAKLKFNLPKIPTDEVFGFQILEREGEKLKIKIDTTSLETRRIYKSYKNYDKYEVIHIPNFKTTRRYLTAKDFIQKPEVTEIDLVNSKKYKNAEVGLFPEFWEYRGNVIKLKWGEMLAGENFDLYDLQDAIDGRFLLSVGFQDFQIQLMEIWIIPDSAKTKIYRTDHLNHPQVQAALRNVSPGTTILFTQILIENKNQELFYLPNSFFFGIQ